MIIKAAIKFGKKIYLGNAHAEIIQNNIHLFSKKIIYGFINNKNIFLNRQEAAIEAFECGQTSCKYFELSSEKINI